MIYWIKAGDTGAVKVGFAARDVSARIRLLQTGCPWPLILLRVEPGERDLEASLHVHYRSKHLRAEWFALDAADVGVDLASVRRKRAAGTKRKFAHPGSKLSAFMLNGGYTLVSFGTLIGVTNKQTMSRYVRGDRFPPADVLVRIREATNGQVTADDFADQHARAHNAPTSAAA